MPALSAETIIRTLREIYGYEIAPPDAETIAGIAGGLLSMGAALKSIDIEGIEAPFGYEVLATEAARVGALRRGAK